jgi:hypothetical protein
VRGMAPAYCTSVQGCMGWGHGSIRGRASGCSKWGLWQSGSSKRGQEVATRHCSRQLPLLAHNPWVESLSWPAGY